MAAAMGAFQSITFTRTQRESMTVVPLIGCMLIWPVSHWPATK